MGKYWAIYLMSWVLRVLAVLTIILPILWVIGLALNSPNPLQPVYVPSRENPFPTFSLPPTSAPPVDPGADRVINYIAQTAALSAILTTFGGWLFTALALYTSGQLLLLLIEVAENTRPLRSLRRRDTASPAPDAGVRYQNAPWMRRGY